ncbi:MAG: hypothetical protein Q4F88_02055 [Eubacteriales bacterium]|nr:hypothetical protein [Eubacteriales bacterium]
MNFEKIKRIISIVLISTLMLNLTSCALFPTGDDALKIPVKEVMPYDEKRIYTKADLYKYEKADLEATFKVYEKDFTDFFYNNTNLAELKDEEKENFSNILVVKNGNYSTYKKYLETFDEEKHKEYLTLPNCDYMDFIDSNGYFKDNHISKMEINLLLDTLKDEGLYYSMDADFFERLSVDKDFIETLLPNSSSSVASANEAFDYKNYQKKFTLKMSEDGYISKDIIDVEFTAMSTSSYTFVNKGNYSTIMLREINDDNQTYDLYDMYGQTFNRYIATRRVNILKGTMVGFATSFPDLAYMILKSTSGLMYNSIDDIIQKHEQGGFVHEMYEKSIYSNRVFYDEKGYITSLTTFATVNNSSSQMEEMQKMMNLSNQMNAGEITAEEYESQMAEINNNLNNN